MISDARAGLILAGIGFLATLLLHLSSFFEAPFFDYEMRALAGLAVAALIPIALAVKSLRAGPFRGVYPVTPQSLGGKRRLAFFLVAYCLLSTITSLFRLHESPEPQTHSRLLKLRLWSAPLLLPYYFSGVYFLFGPGAFVRRQPDGEQEEETSRHG
ncbi:MAG: hypothetical protein V2A74_09915 [bacterium]